MQPRVEQVSKVLAEEQQNSKSSTEVKIGQKLSIAQTYWSLEFSLCLVNKNKEQVKKQMHSLSVRPKISN